MKKIISILGARPQFIKAATVSRIFKKHFDDKFNELIIHTGQHFDQRMSEIFFTELDIPKPKYNLHISGGSHGEMTGRMMIEIERILLDERPDLLLVYGDTNSTLAGSLAASKLNIPIAHIEAGLRSFNNTMPEEINRILTDKVSSLLFCPTDISVSNLSTEGITTSVFNVGDVMFDSSLYYADVANRNSRILNELKVTESKFVLATCHRAENTDNFDNLKNIIQGLVRISAQLQVIFPLHPRTQKILLTHSNELNLSNLKIIPPLSFLDMVKLEQSAYAIATDSGGVQKEAFFFKKPCITFRNETEWVETVTSGWNTLTGADSKRIYDAFINMQTPESYPTYYGNGNAAVLISQHLENFLYLGCK